MSSIGKSIFIFGGLVSLSCASMEQKNENRNMDIARYIPANSATFYYTPEPLVSEIKC